MQTSWTRSHHGWLCCHVTPSRVVHGRRCPLSPFCPTSCRCGDCSRPLAFELDPILREIGARLAQVAKGLYLRAEAEENRIAIKFDGWLPAEKPTDAFTKKWTGLSNTASGNVTCLFPRDADSIPGANGDVPRDDRNTS